MIFPLCDVCNQSSSEPKYFSCHLVIVKLLGHLSSYVAAKLVRWIFHLLSKRFLTSTMNFVYPLSNMMILWNKVWNLLRLISPLSCTCAKHLGIIWSNYSLHSSIGLSTDCHLWGLMGWRGIRWSQMYSSYFPLSSLYPIDTYTHWSHLLPYLL